MITDPSATIHGSAVLIGPRAVLIRGPSGAGKSRLALSLIQAADAGLVAFARLVGDDRLTIEACHGRLLARPPAELAGLIEVRGLGIRRLPYEPVAVIGLAVDLTVADAERLPSQGRDATLISGIKLPSLAIAIGADPLPAVLAFFLTADAHA